MRWMGGLFILAISGCSLAVTGHRMMSHRVERSDFVEERLALFDGEYLYWDNGRPGDSRPVLVLLHGFGGDGLGTWTPIMRHFAEDYRVLVPDLLWFGASHGLGAPRLEAQVLAVQEMLKVEELEKATVVGLSYGGFVALGMMQALPASVERLVIMDSPGPFFGEEEEQAMLGRFAATSVEALFLPAGGKDVQRLLSLAWYRAPKLPGFLLQDLYIHEFSRWQEAQRLLIGDLRGRRGNSVLPPLNGTPALVIWGRHDRVFPLPIGEKLAAELGAPLVVIEEAAHGPNIEKPMEVAAALREWLE